MKTERRRAQDRHIIGETTVKEWWDSAVDHGTGPVGPIPMLVPPCDIAAEGADGDLVRIKVVRRHEDYSFFVKDPHGGLTPIRSDYKVKKFYSGRLPNCAPGFIPYGTPRIA